MFEILNLLFSLHIINRKTLQSEKTVQVKVTVVKEGEEKTLPKGKKKEIEAGNQRKKSPEKKKR